MAEKNGESTPRSVWCFGAALPLEGMKWEAASRQDKKAQGHTLSELVLTP